jgi:hypothetical protein
MTVISELLQSIERINNINNLELKSKHPIRVMLKLRYI